MQDNYWEEREEFPLGSWRNWGGGDYCGEFIYVATLGFYGKP